ncbi:MAG: DUF4359 domain-containing protein [Kiritimatiellae bacterium]|nr:DUF4359 domain-containing protein [Kiritimatiellia bacterium]
MDDFKELLIGAVVLGILAFTNPSKSEHREAICSYVVQEARKTNDPYVGLGLVFGGQALMDAFLKESLNVKSYGIFSMGYIGNKCVTFGIFKYVHVIDD